VPAVKKKHEQFQLEPKQYRIRTRADVVKALSRLHYRVGTGEANVDAAAVQCRVLTTLLAAIPADASPGEFSVVFDGLYDSAPTSAPTSPPEPTGEAKV
jgi:hypothetical protein